MATVMIIVMATVMVIVTTVMKTTKIMIIKSTKHNNGIDIIHVTTSPPSSLLS